MTIMPETTLQIRELTTNSGHRIGRITLNVPGSLNALSYVMITSLQQQLLRWQEDAGIVCVILDGAGERGFCAGGDVRELVRAVEQGDRQAPERFFTSEYKLDHLIHIYRKPLLVWGNGLLMGGGMGLFAGASHRLVTESTLMAMPEISIGLFPDVGATWYLSRLPNKLGRFIGLTGARLNASDMLKLGLADHFVQDAHREVLFEQLAELAWEADPARDKHHLDNALMPFKQAALAHQPHHVEQLWERLSDLCQLPTLSSFYQAVSELNGSDPWLKQARDNLLQGSPLTAAVAWEALRRGAELSLADCFRMELGLAVQMVLEGDFREGIRARLIDKDNMPSWRFSQLDQIGPDVIARLFAPLWPAHTHPLADL